MASEADEIQAKRREIMARASREPNVDRRMEILQKEDEPLRKHLVDHYAAQDPAHARARAGAREAMERFQQTGSTFQKR